MKYKIDKGPSFWKKFCGLERWGREILKSWIKDKNETHPFVLFLK
jgi:hypothetical protein